MRRNAVTASALCCVLRGVMRACVCVCVHVCLCLRACRGLSQNCAVVAMKYCLDVGKNSKQLKMLMYFTKTLIKQEVSSCLQFIHRKQDLRCDGSLSLQQMFDIHPKVGRSAPDCSDGRNALNNYQAQPAHKTPLKYSVFVALFRRVHCSSAKTIHWTRLRHKFLRCYTIAFGEC